MLREYARRLLIITLALGLLYGFALLCSWGMILKFQRPNGTHDSVMTFIVLPVFMACVVAVFVLGGMASMFLLGVCYPPLNDCLHTAHSSVHDTVVELPPGNGTEAK